MKDNYNISENPQFLLDVQNAKSGAVWILLTRHITELEDFKDNREYITVMVYKNDGKKVYYPSKNLNMNSSNFLKLWALDCFYDIPNPFFFIICL